MKVRIPVIVKDPETSQDKDITPTEQIVVEEDVFLDGPVSPRVALLDFDATSGRLLPGVRVVPVIEREREGSYAIDRPVRPGDMQVSPGAAAVSVFGAVHKTMKMFEERDALGRKVAWAFGAPQLLVVPMAGEWANAYYERESHSLQFFFFKAEGNGGMVHTCYSQDIVAHETAHALLDGIAPDLYTAITPQSLAIHEAVADLASLLCSFRCRELTSRILSQTGGSIQRSSAFSGLAEQFGSALQRSRPYLRNLNNSKSLRPSASAEDRVARNEPHGLSEVLSGAFYRVLVKMHDELRKKYERGEDPGAQFIGTPEEKYVQEIVDAGSPAGSAQSATAASTKALFIVGERLKRMLLRGLDYLPPGDVTFADLARAVLASDQASHPRSALHREWLKEEFHSRGIVDSPAELDVETNYRHRALRRLDLENLVASDYAAYTFANKNRELLRIPKDVTFEVRPRLDVTKLYWHRDGKHEVRECLFKVSWTGIERNVSAGGLPRKRRFTAGTTLAIEWGPTPLIRAVISTERTHRDRRDTDDLIRSLVDEDILRLGDRAIGPRDRPLQGVIAADITAGAMRIRSAARMLHITREH